MAAAKVISALFRTRLLSIVTMCVLVLVVIACNGRTRQAREAIGGNNLIPVATASASSVAQGEDKVSGTPDRASTASPASRFSTFGTVKLQPEFELRGQGVNIDSIAFWEAPDPADTLMFVTSKRNHLVEVWKYPFENSEQSPIEGIFGAANVNGIAMDQQKDLLYVSQAKDVSTIYAFSISSTPPYWELKLAFGEPDLGSEPNQDILLRSNGETWLYVSDSRKDVHIWNVEPVSLGGEPDFVGSFATVTISSIETVLADDYYQVVYVPDENGRTGIYAFKPDGAPHQRNNTNRFGGEVIFQSDAEGIILYACRSPEGRDTGHGFIVVADQRDELTDLEFFDRRTWEHLGTLQIEGVWNTDGLASTQQPLPDYPLGILAAVHDDKTTVGVGWDKFFEASGVSCGEY